MQGRSADPFLLANGFFEMAKKPFTFMFAYALCNIATKEAKI